MSRARARATPLAWGAPARATGGSGHETGAGDRPKENGDREQLNHERPNKGLPVRPAGDARPDREEAARAW